MCVQVAIERKATLFVDDPTKIPELEKNNDWVKYGLGNYIGAPWVVRETKGGWRLRIGLSRYYIMGERGWFRTEEYGGIYRNYHVMS